MLPSGNLLAVFISKGAVAAFPEQPAPRTAFAQGHPSKAWRIRATLES